MTRVTRRTFGLGIATGLAVGALARPARAETRTLRIGYQKIGAFALLKPTGKLEEVLKPLGYDVNWVQFPSGPPLLEALNAGAIDIGHGGESPPIFAQAASSNFLYIGHEPAAPEAEAILVPKESPLKSVAELKGRKVALNKGSNVHYLLVRALEKAGLRYDDIDIAFLAPADGRAAFEKGAVDAWVIWEPFRAAAEVAVGARTLADGTGLVANHEFFFSTKSFAAGGGKPVIDAVLAQSKAVYLKAAQDIDGTAETFSRSAGIPKEAFRLSLQRKSLDVLPITHEIVVQQQKIADVFHGLGLIPKPIRIADAVDKSAA